MEDEVYEKVKRVVAEIYEENYGIVPLLPVDVFKLAKNMGFDINKASSLINNIKNTKHIMK